ncbi:hypothetical protein EOM09_06355 [bacterium]|nr:hypothetical protein [bacterium]
MAYIKYKELAKYFNFNKRIEISTLPNYVHDYLYKDEVILAAYKTSRDKAVFTDKRMVLFDVTPITSVKKIHIIPYSSISTSAIVYEGSQSKILLSFDSGYQLRLDFTKMNSDDKKQLRLLYFEIMKNIK